MVKQTFIFDNYQKCDTDNDCRIVKSPHPCEEVEAMNKEISEEEYSQHFRRISAEYSEYTFKCYKREFTTENSRPICDDGYCRLEIKK